MATYGRFSPRGRGFTSSDLERLSQKKGAEAMAEWDYEKWLDKYNIAMDKQKSIETIGNVLSIASTFLMPGTGLATPVAKGGEKTFLSSLFKNILGEGAQKTAEDAGKYSLKKLFVKLGTDNKVKQTMLSKLLQSSARGAATSMAGRGGDILGKAFHTGGKDFDLSGTLSFPESPSTEFVDTGNPYYQEAMKQYLFDAKSRVQDYYQGRKGRSIEQMELGFLSSFKPIISELLDKYR